MVPETDKRLKPLDWKTKNLRRNPLGNTVISTVSGQ